MYLKPEDLINLCYVSKNMRNLVLNNFNQIFDLSTGFCTVKYWNVYIETNCFALCNDIFTAKYFDEKFLDYNFDFEENYFRLVRDFRHMSLFSICLHFLRCTRSCDNKANYCRVCSRVREKFFMDCNAFSSLCVLMELICICKIIIELILMFF